MAETNVPDLKTLPSENLAAMVVAYKTIGIYKELALSCMTELSIRRSNGDNFAFEEFIDKEASKIPKIESTNLISLTSMISNFNSKG